VCLAPAIVSSRKRRSRARENRSPDRGSCSEPETTPDRRTVAARDRAVQAPLDERAIAELLRGPRGGEAARFLDVLAGGEQRVERDQLLAELELLRQRVRPPQDAEREPE